MHRILIFAKFSKDKISGGRLYAWSLAEALAEYGHNVCVITNEKPRVAAEFAHFPAHEEIDLIVCPKFKGWEYRTWDFVIVIPDITLNAAVFGPALRAKAKNKAKLIFVDFEAPTWFCETSGSSRSRFRTMWWNITARHCHMIISLTKLGKSYAMEYYKPLNGRESFVVCPAPIQDRSLPISQPVVENRMLFIGRKTTLDKHKQADWVMQLLPDCVPPKSIITLIGSFNSIDLELLKRRTENKDIKIEHFYGISDTEKFKLIARSKVLLFASKFEGFGLPPVEAACCGTPCVATYLPVLDENVGDGIASFVEQDDTDAIKTSVNSFMLQEPPIRIPTDKVKHTIQRFGFSTAFKPRIGDHINKLDSMISKHQRTLELRGVIVLFTFWSIAMKLGMWFVYKFSKN